MKRNLFRILLLLLLLAVGNISLYAQYGFGTNNPDASSVMDMKSENKGVLFPRVSLTSTTVADPVTSPAVNMVVFNINSTVDPGKEYSATSVTPGLYSWNGTEWVRLLTTDGPVGVGVATPRKSAVLDVTSSTQGLLPPRMNNDQIAKIKDPVEGLLVFNTEQNCLMYYANATFRCSYADAASNQGAVMSSNAAPKYQTVIDGVVSDIGVVNAFASTSSPYAGFTATATPATYYDDDGDDEVTPPLYQWYRYDNATGTEGKTPIGTTSTYTITEDDGGKYIQASIQAVAATGTSPGAEQNASTVLGPVWTCGSSVSASYSNGDGISPLTEDKTIDYGITRIGTKCWITRNLGAETDPALITDVNAATTGWYWQFGTKQGLSSADGATLSGWASYTAPTAWSPDSDPCRQSLGVAWHIPTLTEWKNLAVNDGNYNTLTKGFNSALKIIPSGYFDSQTVRFYRDVSADYWTNEMYTASNAAFAQFYSSNKVDNVIYTKALSIRCVHDIAAPAVVDGNAAPSFAKVENTAANLYPGGIATVVSVGYTDTDTDPAAAPLYRWYRYNDAAGTDGKTLITTTTPNYTFTAADEGKYIRAAAMAVATKGTLQGEEQDATTVLGPVWTCGTDISVAHPAWQNINDVTPSNVTADLTINYGIHREGTKCWITRNLGATADPISATDATAAATGWHFQFNRIRGYDNVNGSLSGTWDPTSYTNPAIAWSAGTDPCRQSLGVAWHVPTTAEWQAICDKYADLDAVYSSGLKIAAGGYFDNQSQRSLNEQHAVYWTQGVSGNNGMYARFSSTDHVLVGVTRVYALPVRCVREIADASVVAGNAGPRFSSVINTGDPLYSGAVVTAVASGYQDDNNDLQNTTSTVYHWYRYDDAACTVGKVQIGSASTYTLTVADEGKYVLASAQPVALTGTILGEEKYATTSLGPVWTCGSLVSASYLNGDGISPLAEAKTIDYGITRIGTKCWITKNLGAESQPTSKSDANIAAIGWYWQFGTKQGLSSNGSALSSWASYAAPTAWSPDSDPCRQSLSVEWHVPTRQELYDVFTTANYYSLTDAYNSALKIGAAGFFSEQKTKEKAGTGYCWSSEMYSASNAHYVGLGDSYNMDNRPYWYAKPVRCVHDIAAPGIVPNNDAPFYNVSNVINTANKPYAGEVATVAVTSFQDKENDPATAPLYKWYRYNDAACTQGKTFTGATTSTYTITTADEGKYIRASVWAVATKGTLLGNEVFASTALGPIWSCENSVNMKWIEGDGVYPPAQPVSIDYGIVKIGNKCWITRNLGATATPGSATDYSSVAVTGWYWQYNRPQAYAYNTTTKALSGWDVNAFATTTTSWLPANDPCTKKLGSNWHIPTKAEWGDLQDLSNFNNLTNVYNGVLKIATSGYFTSQTARAYPDTRADYWTNQNYNTTTGYFAEFNNVSGSYTKLTNCVFYYALSVRCVYDIAAPK